MKIGFEAKRFFTNYTGLGNYSRLIVSALSSHYPDNQHYLFTPRRISNGEVDDIIQRPNVKVKVPEGIYSRVPSLWRTWGLSFGMEAKQLDVFHGLSQELPFNLSKKVKKVVTVHDLIFLRYPAFYHAWDVSIYEAKVKSACRRADKIIAISEQTRQDVIDFLNIHPEKVEVVYQGCHPIFKQRILPDVKEKVRKKYGLPDQFILNVGTIEKRKNIILLVEALALLPESLQLPVVIMGRPSIYMNEIVEKARSLNVLNKLHFLHDASFQDFPAIYQLAAVFVYPSLFEGFGIPLLEAIESDTPVITSTGSCFIEAAGPDALYVDPTSSDAMANALSRVLTDGDLRDKMILNSRKFIDRFTPPKIADRLMNVYEGVINNQKIKAVA